MADMIRRWTALLALFAMGSLDAAAAVAGAPSLARRPAELREREGQPAAPAAMVLPADPALDERVRQLVAGAQAADAAFGDALAADVARVAAGRATAISSEAWVVAQNAISALDSLRYETVAALAMLDSLHIARMQADALADLAVIDPARLRLLAMVDRQNDRLDQLKARLKVP